MKKIAKMRFNSNDELLKFLSNHKDMELLYKDTKDFLLVESENKEYKNMIVAEFTNKDEKITITSLEKYQFLTDNAKRIINSIKYSNEINEVKLQINKTFVDDFGYIINVDKALYYEIFNFAMDVGLKFARYDVEDGEEIMICLDINGILSLD